MSPASKAAAAQPNDGFTQQDRDYLIRTVIGEAADQPPAGQAAVAYSVLNRLKDGDYGNSPTQIVLAPNQYEPWTTRSRQLMAIPQSSNIYQDVGKIVDGVISGKIPDPTNGATHFLNESIVRQRRGGTLPAWARGQGIQIGAHTFFGGNKAVAANNQQTPDYLGEFIDATTSSSAPAKNAATPSVSASTTPKNDYLGEFLKAKSSQPDQPQTPALPPGTDSSGDRIPVPDHPEGYYNGRLHITIHNPANDPSEFHERTIKPILNLPSELMTVGKDYGNRLMQLFGQNANAVGQGVTDIAHGMPATGVGEAALGALGYLGAPVQAVDVPLTKMTGNPDFGEKAAMLIPMGGVGKVANAARPVVSALKDIVKDVGTENIPAVVGRLKSNPNLTLMDVVPTVRANAAGLATDPRNAPAMTHLNQFQNARMAARPADTVNIFEDALGPTPNMAQTVQSLKQRAADTGKNLIEPALEKASPIPIKTILKPLDRMINSPEAIAGETPRIPLDPTQIRLLNLRHQITSGESAPLNERVGFAIGPINDALKSGTLGANRTADFTEARRLLNSARRGNTSEEDLISGLKALAKKQKIVGPIDDALKMITKGPTEYRSPVFVHGVQSRLREEASNLSKSATGSDRNMASSLHQARDNLVNAIDKSSGGAYRPALKQYAADKAIDDAFREGFNAFSNPTNAEAMIANHPDMWKEWMAGASDAEKRAVAQGILFGANNKALNMRRGLDVPENSFTHQRIASVIGKKNADEIVRRLHDWRDIAETDNLLTKNSATAVRQAGQQARSVREPRSSKDILQSLMPGAVVGGAASMLSGGSPILTGGAGAGAIALGKLLNIAGRAHDIASNTAYAKLASAMGPQKHKLIDILEHRMTKSNPVSRSQKLLNLVPPAVLQALPR